MSDRAEKLLFRAYLGLRVLQTMCDRKSLVMGVTEAGDIIREIERDFPHFPAKASLR